MSSKKDTVKETEISSDTSFNREISESHERQKQLVNRALIKLLTVLRKQQMKHEEKSPDLHKQ